MTNMETNTWPVWLVVAIWAGISLALNIIDVFEPNLIAFLISVIGPPILFAFAYRLLQKVRTLSLSLDLRLLTAFQAWRLIGVMFLVLLSLGLLPGTFAWPAGIGDVIVGAYAPFVVVAISRQAPGWHKHAVLLNILGLLDFVGAIGGGVLSGGGILLELPLSMIPTFAVPFWIVLHMISLIKLRNPEAQNGTAELALITQHA